MQSLPAATQFEIGLDSMSSVLSKISLGTSEGNSFLSIIEKDIYNLKNDIEMVLFKSLTYHSKSKDILGNILFTVTESNFVLTDILTLLQNSVAIDNKRIKSENNWKEKLYNTFLNQDSLSTVNEGYSKTDRFLESIDKNVSNIFKKLTGGKLDKDIDKKIIKEDKAIDKAGGKSHEIFAGFKQFAESLVIVKANLTSKLISSVDKFGVTYQKLLDNTSESKMNVFGETMEKFGIIISDLTSDKKLKTATYLIGGLALSFGLLSLATINPMFIAGIGVIAGFVFLMSRISSDKELNPGMQGFGLGVAALTAALMLIQFVPWQAAIGMLGFITGLGIALRTFKTDNKLGGGKGNEFALTYFAAGITGFVLSMLLLQFVPWQAGLGMIGFIAGLGLALKFFSGPKGVGGDLKSNPMIGFAMGIGILTLALFAMAEIPVTSIFKMLLFVGGLGLVMKAFNFDEIGKSNSMFSFAFGLGLMTLAILAIGEIENETLIKGILFIGSLGLVMRAFNFDKMGPKNAMVSFAFGFSIMVLAMYAINELPWEALGKTLLFLGGLGLVMQLFKGTEGASFLMLSGGIVLIAGALYIFKKTNFTIEDALMFGGIIIALTAVMVAIGIPAVAALAGLGALTMVGIAASSLLIGLSLAAISALEFNPTNVGYFMLSAGILAFGFALLTVPAVAGLVGATLFIPIAIATILAATSLAAISNMEFDTSKVINFMLSAGTLTAGFALLALPAVPGLVGATLFFPIASSALLGALVLALISKITIDSNKITIFGDSAKHLVEVMWDLISWDLAGTAAGVALLIPVFSSALLAGVALRLISSLDIKSDKISSFGSTMGLFVDTISNVLSRNEDKLKESQPGIKALAQLMNVSTGIARTIQMMANMQFFEYGVENGKLVLKGVRTLTKDDFLRVGINLSSMLECLINPLLILGSDTSTFNIGGKTLINPFKSGAAMRGIEVLSNLGNAFKPLADSVKTYASIPMVSNPELMRLFSNSLVLLTNTFDYVFRHISKFDNDLITDSIESIIKFNEAFKDADTKQITDLNGIMEKFMHNLSDNVRWKKIQANLNTIKNQFGDIAKNINSIDINKATLFERNIRNLVTQNNGENLRLAVESLTELLGMVKENQAVSNNQSTGSTEPTFVEKASNVFGFRNDDKNNIKNKPKTKETNISEFEGQALALLQQIISAISGTNSALNNKLKVQIVGGNANNI